MFILGHLGFSRLLAEPFKKMRPISQILVGSLLPDVVDKSIFYLSRGAVPGTRSIGHTLLFFIVVAFAEHVRKKTWIRLPIAFGTLTHLIADNFGDLFVVQDSVARNLRILLWPSQGLSFPPTVYLNLSQQVHRMYAPYFLTTEILGLGILFFFAWSERRKPPADLSGI